MTRPDIEFDYKFNCDCGAAGGDWELSNYYFRCQMVDGSTPYRGKKHITFSWAYRSVSHLTFYIYPSIAAGNNHLVESSKAKHKWVAINNGDVSQKDAKNIPELDPKKAWEWLEKYLKNYMDAYFKDRQKFRDHKN